MSNITITLRKANVIHDIDQWTYRVAKMRIADWESRSDAQSSDSDEDQPYYLRKITEAVAKVRSILSDRIADSEIAASDDLPSSSTWDITLTEGNFTTSVHTLTDLIHRYVVRSVLADWALAYAGDAAAQFQTEAETAKAEMKHEAMSRKRPELDDNSVTEEKTVIIE